MSDTLLNIVFVDDEPKILDGLRRQLRSHRDRWNMRFAASGPATLAMLREQPADVVVSDMRMPGMSGAQLLTQVARLHPETIRFILSGQTDQADLLNEIGCIHQYLQKPCDGDLLCKTIERVQSFSGKLAPRSLRTATTGLTALPPVAENYPALIGELKKENANLAQIASLVAQDPALTAKLMQLVNSAFFGMPRNVTSAHEAVGLLGLKALNGIIVSGKLFESSILNPGDQEIINLIWATSAAVSEAAARLARMNGADDATINLASVAGLLSLIGRVILIMSKPGMYQNVISQAQNERRSLDHIELEIFGASQADVGAYALGIWGFNDELIEAVAFQHRPSKTPRLNANPVVGYLHIASVTVGQKSVQPDRHNHFDEQFLAACGLMHLSAGKPRVAA